MPRLSLTKNELKRQRDNLNRYHRYLPTLDLKKRQLQREWLRVRAERTRVEARGREERQALDAWVSLLGESLPLRTWLRAESVEVSLDQVAGLPVPVFVRINFARQDHDLLLTPLWVDRALEVLSRLMTLLGQATVLRTQESLLQRELRVTSQRVNLFEHIKIPEAEANIRRIRVALNDAQTAAFGWAMAARRKLERLS